MSAVLRCSILLAQHLQQHKENNTDLPLTACSLRTFEARYSCQNWAALIKRNSSAVPFTISSGASFRLYRAIDN